MNTKQLLALTLTFSLAANIVAMEESDKDKARRLREEAQQRREQATQRRIAELQAEKDAKKTLRPSSGQAATSRPVTKKPVAPVTPPVKAPAAPAKFDINNNNNVQPAVVKTVAKVVAPSKTVAAIIPSKPVVPAKDKEELDPIFDLPEIVAEPSIWVRDRAKNLSELTADLENYCNSVISSDEAQIAEGFRQFFTNPNFSRPMLQQLRERATSNLQLIETAYAKDADFAKLRPTFEALVMIYNLQEQLLDDATNAEQWELINETLTSLLAQENTNTKFVTVLTKLKDGFAAAQAMVVSSQDEFVSEEDANLAAIRALDELDGEVAARQLQEEVNARADEEANGLAAAQIIAQDERPVTNNDADIAQAIAHQDDEEQANLNLAMALSLETENQPDLNNDALIAESLLAEEREAQEAASLALAREMQEQNQPAPESNDELLAQELAHEAPDATANDAAMAQQIAQQLLDEEAAAQEAATQAEILRLQQEGWN